jgi:hypothetical protein
MTNIHREAVNLPVQNRNVAVGVSAVKVNPYGFQFVKGIQLYAPGASDATPNTETIWLGNAGVTADQNIETGGFPLIPGSAFFLPTEFISDLYVTSATGSQILTWLGV